MFDPSALSTPTSNVIILTSSMVKGASNWKKSIMDLYKRSGHKYVNLNYLLVQNWEWKEDVNTFPSALMW